MPRTQGSDDLYRLIHSLSNFEVRYFRQFALRHSAENKKHLQLFTIIHRQKEFEEASLKREFKAYPEMKVYLFDMLLKSLTQHPENLTSYDNLQMQNIFCNILVKRGLPQKAKQYATRGLAEAREEDMFIQEINFLATIMAVQMPLWNPVKFKQDEQLFGEVHSAIAK
ncbi:MAG: hypothetical protein ACHQVK_04445, partial [Candidatus Paceibacterales bacterium]